MTLPDSLAAALVLLVWASNFVVGKVALAEIPPILLMALRFTVVALVLAPFLRPQPGRMGRIALISLVQGCLHFALMFTGLAGVDAGSAAIATQLFVPFSALLAFLLLGERPTGVHWGGMALAFAGVYLLTGEPRIDPRSTHLAMVVAAAFLMAVGTVLIKRLGPVGAMVLNAWLAVMAVPQLVFASWLFEEGQMAALAAADWRGWGGMLYMAIAATVGAHGLWFYLIGKYPVNRVAPLTLITPVLAVGLSILFLEEPLTLRLLAGGAATLAGVALIQLHPGRRRIPFAEAS